MQWEATGRNEFSNILSLFLSLLLGWGALPPSCRFLLESASSCSLLLWPSLILNGLGPSVSEINSFALDHLESNAISLPGPHCSTPPASPPVDVIWGNEQQNVSTRVKECESVHICVLCPANCVPVGRKDRKSLHCQEMKGDLWLQIRLEVLHIQRYLSHKHGALTGRFILKGHTVLELLSVKACLFVCSAEK